MSALNTEWVASYLDELQRLKMIKCRCKQDWCKTVSLTLNKMKTARCNFKTLMISFTVEMCLMPHMTANIGSRLIQGYKSKLAMHIKDDWGVYSIINEHECLIKCQESLSLFNRYLVCRRGVLAKRGPGNICKLASCSEWASLRFLDIW